MGCCIAIALLIGVVRTWWFKLFPSRAPVQMAFAPPARRAAPGAVVAPAAVPETGVPRVAGPAGPARVSARAGWIVAPAVALAVYAATIAAVSGADAIDSSRPVVVWVVLAVVFVVVALAASAGSHTPASLGSDPAAALGTPLILAGVAWLAVSELDAHVLGVVGHAGLVHAPGPIALSIGLALHAGLVPSRLVPRPSPSPYLRSGAIQ